MRQLLSDAESLYKQQRFGDSLKLIRQALQDDPENAGLLTFMGLCQLKLRRFIEAETTLNKSLHLNPHGDFAYYLCASLELEKGCFKQAEQKIQNAIDVNPINAEYYGILALCRYNRHKSLNEISEIAKKGLNFNSANAMCQNILSLVELRRGKKRLAEDIVSFQLEKVPNDSLSLANQGWISLHSGQYKNALGFFETALEHDPQNDWARNGKIQALKARLPLYRYFLKYILVLSRMSPARRFILVLGIYLVLVLFMNINSFFGLAAMSVVILYAAFIYAAWLGDSLAGMTVSLSRSGKHFLSSVEKRNSFVMSACLLGSGAAGACYLVFRQDAWFLGAAGLLLFCIPLNIGLHEQPSLRRTMARVFLGVLVFLAAAGVLISYWPNGGLAVSIHSGLIHGYIFSALLFSLLLVFVRR